MKKLKEINKVNKDTIIYLIMFVLTCIIFIPFLQGHYAVDTYNIYNIGYDEYATRFSLNDGRIFMFFIVKIASFFNISIEAFVFITLIFAIAISCGVVIALKNIVKKYKNTSNYKMEILLTIICYTTIFNFMYFETMYFVECIVMSLSIASFLYAAYFLVEKNSYIKSIILVTLGVMLYQATICVFVLLLILLSILKNKNNIKSIIKDIFKCFAICVIALIIDFIMIKVIGSYLGTEQNRITTDFLRIIKNIKVIATDAIPAIILESCSLYPKYLFLIILETIVIIMLIYSVKNKKDNSFIYQLILLIVFAILGSFALNIFTLSSCLSGRTKVAIGTLIGAIFIIVYTNSDIFEKGKAIKNILVLTLGIYFISNIVNVSILINQGKEIEKLDKENIIELGNYIKQYEEKNSVNVNKLNFISEDDAKINLNKKAKYKVNQFTVSAVNNYVSVEGILKFYCNIDLKIMKIEREDALKYLEENELTEEGYQCTNDTLYVVVY